MTALLVLLLAVASVIDGSCWVGRRLSRMSVKVRLLVGVLVVVALGVLVGWPVLHLGAGNIVVILVAVGWLCCGMVSQAWWEKLLRARRRAQEGRGVSENDADQLELLTRIIHAGLLPLAVGLCVVVSQSLGSRAAKMSAVVGVIILLAVPANRVVADILTVARRPAQEDKEGRAAGCPSLEENEKIIVVDWSFSQDGKKDPAAGCLSLKKRIKQSESESSMRGGRWIGPLERILILLLASVEAPAAIAAIVAAKGVIRFPEISQDKAGQKAEEFLIGSFASWILAVLGALVIRLA